MRADNSEKPSYKTLASLIHGAWETHDEGITDENGVISFTGFKGGYKISCGGHTAEFRLENMTEMTVYAG